MVLRGRRWPAMGSRYERTDAPAAEPRAGPPETDEERAQLAWKALDRGEDPTDPHVGPGLATRIAEPDRAAAPAPRPEPALRAL